jgi:prepilin-type N-terminal cleavage/methylation domain-containing protein
VKAKPDRSAAKVLLPERGLNQSRRRAVNLRRPPTSRGPTPSSSPDAGFTLVEVLAALVVFVLVAGATITVLIQALRITKDNTDRITAANIARSQVEELRRMGTSVIKPGLTVGGPFDTTDPAYAAYTVRTTANWTAIDQTASSCLSGTTQPNFMRVHVEVTSPTLTTPEMVDALLQPDIETTPTATATIAVTDQDGEPVSDVLVTLSDAAHPGKPNNDSYTTGADGCLLIPSLTAPATLTIAISKAGYISHAPETTTQSIALLAGTLAEPVEFSYAASSRIVFSTQPGGYPVPATMPISWQPRISGPLPTTTAIGSSIDSLWPLDTGFTAWLGSCSDADPEVYSTSRKAYSFAPGGTTTVAAASAPVLVRGLDSGTPVTANYLGPDVACSPRSFALGTTDALGQIKVGLPYGMWQFVGGGEVQLPASPLRPSVDGSTPPPVNVSFSISDHAAALQDANLRGASAQAAALLAGVPTNYGLTSGQANGTDHPDVVAVAGAWTCTANPTNPATPGARVSADVGGGFTVTCIKAGA